MITTIQDERELHQALCDSTAQPVLLFKHSTRCPISAAAHGQFARFAEEASGVSCRQVLVIEQRPLSQLVAQETGVSHASPQVLLLVDGKAVWKASHYEITLEALRKAVLDAAA